MRLGDILKTIITSVAIMLLWNSCSPAHAEVKPTFKDVIPFKLVVVRRPDITVQQQLDIFFAGVARTKEVGTRIKVVAIIETDDVIQENDFSYYTHRLFSWVDWAEKQQIKTKADHIHFLLPPVYSKGVDYGGGVAGAICTTYRNPNRKFSYSTPRLKNLAGADRVDHSQVIVLHEVLHNLGASHSDGKPNVMRSYYTPGEQPIFPVSKKQVNYCKQGKTTQGRFPTVGRRLVFDSENFLN